MRLGQKVAVLLGVLGTIGLIVALVAYGSQPDYAVLFSELKPTDAQSITEKLKSSNVSYQLTNNGTTVMVPADKVSELRLQMAGNGLISGGHVGFDIFDRTSFGATEFTQQVNYQRAIEGELSKTLEGMDEVESARVHVTQPRESIYANKSERAKASVMLRMRQGRVLSMERTEAVVGLVASAIDGLDPANVTVMDTQGRLLSNAGRNGDIATFSSHLDASRKFEAEAAGRIISLLEPISGPGHVRADVAADLDFSQLEQTEEKYDPKSQVIRSQQTSQEVRNNNGMNGPANVVGVRANDPAARPSPIATGSPATAASAATPTPGVAPATTSAAGDQRVASTTNYEIDRIVTHTIGAGGKIKRISVSVLVDYKNISGVFTARTPEELKKIQDVVSAALGIDTNRGDQVVVQTIPFDQPSVDGRTPGFMERHNELIRTITKFGLLAVTALLLIIFVIRPAKKALALAAKQTRQIKPAERSAPLALGPGSSAVEKSAVNLPSPRTVSEIEAEMEAQVAREMATFAPEVVRAGALRKQLIERSKSQPDSVAMTIRGWLQDDSA